MKLSFLVTVSSLAVGLVLGCGGVADLGGTAGGSPAPADGSTPPPDTADSSVGPSPSTDAGPKAPLDPALAARAAAFIGSCFPDDGSNSYLRRFYDRRSGDPLEQLIQASGPCFAGKMNGCAAVTECLGATVAVVGTCAESCDGQMSVRCDDHLEFRLDCTKSGQVCSAVSGRPRCVAAGAQQCDYASYVTSCTGGRPSYCGSVPLVGPVCGDLGLACVPKVDATATVHLCAGTGPACAATSYGPGDATYEGLGCNDPSTLRACVNTFESTLSCPAVGQGFTCQTAGAASFCGLAAECTPGATKPTCEGSSLVMCNAGKITKIDCTSLGFTGCAVKPGVTGGVCTPSP